jgi:hypothetical protein
MNDCCCSLAKHAAQAGPLGVSPFLELRGSSTREVYEEVTRVNFNNGFRITAIPGVDEVIAIGRDDYVEAHWIGSFGHRVASELSAQGVKRNAQTG